MLYDVVQMRGHEHAQLALRACSSLPHGCTVLRQFDGRRLKPCRVTRTVSVVLLMIHGTREAQQLVQVFGLVRNRSFCHKTDAPTCLLLLQMMPAMYACNVLCTRHITVIDTETNGRGHAMSNHV